MSETKGDPGFVFKLFVRIAALVIGGSAFLPFYNGRILKDIGVDMWAAFSESGIPAITTFFFVGAAESIAGKLMTGFLIAIPVIAGLSALSMLIRGRYAGWPMAFSFIFVLVGWIGFAFLGSNFDANIGFFSIVNYGFWVCLGGMSTPFLAMFFLDKSI